MCPIKNLLVYKNGATRWLDYIPRENCPYCEEVIYPGLRTYLQKENEIPLSDTVNVITQRFYRIRTAGNVYFALWVEE